MCFEPFVWFTGVCSSFNPSTFWCMFRTFKKNSKPSNFLVDVFQIVSIWMYKLWVLIVVDCFWCMCTNFCQFLFQFLWCMCLFGSFNFCMYIRTLISLVYLLWYLWLWFIYVYKLWTLIFMCLISVVYVFHFLLWKLCETLKLWNPIL